MICIRDLETENPLPISQEHQILQSIGFSHETTNTTTSTTGNSAATVLQLVSNETKFRLKFKN